ncbi:MAG: ankyrin repeat domain-containing protein [Campylobacterales bacterium]|nr:ankyrin repeat domain-containing protein [Campylobacterales bacterium]
MTKLRTIALLFMILHNLLFAQDNSLAGAQKQILLNWVNKNCTENHLNYESLQKDRYFICNSLQHPEGLQGSVRLYEKGLDKHTKREIIFFTLLFLFGFIAMRISLAFSRIRERKLVQEKIEDPVPLFSRQNVKIRFMMHISIGLVLLIGYKTYQEAKAYTEEQLLNPCIENISIVLPFYNLFHNDENALILAIRSGYVDIVRYLIEEKGYDPNKRIDNKLPYDVALSQKSYDIANYLKKFSSDEE